MGSMETSFETQQDVLIIGAGPVGLALALDLGKRGVRSLVIERKPGPATEIEAKASVINERSMEYLRYLGVRDENADAGYPKDLPGDTIFCTSLSGNLIGRLEMHSQEERERPEQSREMLQRCPQFLFDPVLARAVARQKMAEIHYNTEYVSSEQDDSGVTCVVRRVPNGQEELVHSRYLVACDKPSSAVRKSLSIAFEGKDLGCTLSAIVEVKDLARQHSFGRAAERYLFIGPEGTWGNFTTIDGRDL